MYSRKHYYLRGREIESEIGKKHREKGREKMEGGERGGRGSCKVHSYCNRNNMLEEKYIESSCKTAPPPSHSQYCKSKKNIEKYWNIEQGNENEWVG